MNITRTLAIAAIAAIALAACESGGMGPGEDAAMIGDGGTDAATDTAIEAPTELTLEVGELRFRADVADPFGWVEIELLIPAEQERECTASELSAVDRDSVGHAHIFFERGIGTERQQNRITLNALSEAVRHQPVVTLAFTFCGVSDRVVVPIEEVRAFVTELRRWRGNTAPVTPDELPRMTEYYTGFSGEARWQVETLLSPGAMLRDGHLKLDLLELELYSEPVWIDVQQTSATPLDGECPLEVIVDGAPAASLMVAENNSREWDGEFRHEVRYEAEESLLDAIGAGADVTFANCIGDLTLSTDDIRMVGGLADRQRSLLTAER